MRVSRDRWIWEGKDPGRPPIRERAARAVREEPPRIDLQKRNQATKRPDCARRRTWLCKRQGLRCHRRRRSRRSCRSPNRPFRTSRPFWTPCRRPGRRTSSCPGPERPREARRETVERTSVSWHVKHGRNADQRQACSRGCDVQTAKQMSTRGTISAQIGIRSQGLVQEWLSLPPKSIAERHSRKRQISDFLLSQGSFSRKAPFPGSLSHRVRFTEGGLPQPDPFHSSNTMPGCSAHCASAAPTSLSSGRAHGTR